jgi:O-antigen ligase
MSQTGQVGAKGGIAAEDSTPMAVAATALAVIGVALLAMATRTPLVALALVVMMVAFTLRPAFGPPLLACSLPFVLQSRNLGSMAFSMPELVLLSMVVGGVLYAARRAASGSRADLSALATPLDGQVALLLAAAITSLVASELLRVSLRELRTLVLEPLLAYYLAVWFLRRRSDLQLLQAGMLIGGAAIAVIGLYQYFFNTNVVDVEGSRRILGPYLSPNHAGLYMGRMIPMALALAIFNPGVRRLALPLLVLLSLAQLLTFSVGAWLGTGSGILLVLLLWKRRSALVLGGGVLALFAASLPFSSMERISSHFNLSRGTSFLRIQLWESSIQMIRDHPIFGVGMDNFLYQYRSGYLSPEAAAEPNLSHPHNLILNFWLQMGILGVAAAAWLAVSITRLWRRLWHSGLTPWEQALSAGIAGAMADMVVHGMVDNSYFLADLAFLFWMLVGTIVVLGRPFSPRPNRVN